MSVADSASSLQIFVVVTGLTGLLALLGAVVGGGFGLKSPLGWVLGSSAFLLPLLVGSIGSVVVLLHVQKELNELEPVIADQIIMAEFTRAMFPIGLGLALTVVCVIAFFVAGIVSGVLRKRKQRVVEGASS